LFADVAFHHLFQVALEDRASSTLWVLLFAPANVEEALAGLPSVAALLPEPAREGVPSEAFPVALRKTEREVYRWLANTHYEHLADALEHLERVHAAGCTFGTLLATRDREQFVSRTAEVLVADDLLRRGFTVKTITATGGAVPDLHVVADGVDLAVEVYSPRELLALDAWVDELKDLLNYADIRASYTFNVSTGLERSIPPDWTPLDPWAPARMLAQTHDGVMADITADVEDSLRGLRPLSKVYRHSETPLLTTVEIDDLQVAPDAGPARAGSFSYPGFGGYWPAGVFRTIVERAQRKARKRQAHGVPATARALVVSLMGTKTAEDLAHPVHNDQAAQALEQIEPQVYGLDVIAFVVRALPHGLAAILTVADDTTLSIPQVEAMFGQTPSR